MLKKILSQLVLLGAFSCAMAGNAFQFDETDAGASAPQMAGFTCSDDATGLIIKKRALQKKFGECIDKESNYSVSILFFTVAEGTSGTSEKDSCLMEYRDSVVTLQLCAMATQPGTYLFSLDESFLYLASVGGVGDFVRNIQNYEELSGKVSNASVIDGHNFEGLREVAKYAAAGDDFISEANVSREDKDIAKLYLLYLRSKYDWTVRCKVKPAFVCDTSWLAEKKAEFLQKYPESQYKNFVETAMPAFTDMTDEEKKLAAADNEKVEEREHEIEIQKIKEERNVWISASAMLLAGLPVTVTKGFDDNFNASNMMNLAFKLTWSHLLFQYQYYFSFGENNKGGSISEKGYALLGGISFGPLKKLTVDLLFGLSYMDLYPAAKDMPFADLDYESFMFALQGSYYFPIFKSMDVFAHFQVGMHYVENYCSDSYWRRDEGGFSNSYRCHDPNATNKEDRFWDDMQWTFSVGVGVRFWKPRY